MPVSVQLLKNETLEWDNYVYANPLSTTYHQSGWKEVLEKTFGHRTFYLYAMDETGKITGILPLVYMKSFLFFKFMVSLPFLTYGGILFDDEETKKALLAEGEKITKNLRAAFMELRHLHNYTLPYTTRFYKVTMILNLRQDVDSQWKCLKDSIRRNINRAIKKEVRIEQGHFDMLDDFYEIYSRGMKEFGTPVYGKDFFKNILKKFPHNTSIFSMVFHDKVIGAAFAIWYKDAFEIPWIYSLKSHRHLNANSLLYWEAISRAIRNGFKKFDFGRSTAGEGTYVFKKRWGAIPAQILNQYYVQNIDNIPSLDVEKPLYKFFIRAWKKIPLNLTRFIGPIVIKNIPC